MIQDEMRNAMINTTFAPAYRTSSPAEYGDRERQYFQQKTRSFHNEYLKYARDFVEAKIQGLDPDKPFEYTKVHIRFADIVRASGAISNAFDNYKLILIQERQYDYIRRGAKVIAMGNTWLVLNPDNMSGGCKAVIQRCDTTWNYLDYYGNIRHEPMCVNTLMMRANDSDSQRSAMIAKGYFNVTMQYNDATKQLFTNSRIMLGSSAYRLTGYSDFSREFTFDENSVNMISFTVRYEEPNDNLDDRENMVADAKMFAWDIAIKGEPTLTAGETEQLTASSMRTYGGKTEPVESTKEHPIDYIWTSSDKAVATVDCKGVVTAVSEGKATITARLFQNPDKYMTTDITVASAETPSHVAFLNTVPTELQMYQSMTLTAAYYESGEATENEVEWELSGADEDSYSFETTGNTVTIRCWRGCIEPLTITASYGGYSVSAKIFLTGL